MAGSSLRGLRQNGVRRKRFTIAADGLPKRCTRIRRPLMQEPGRVLRQRVAQLVSPDDSKESGWRHAGREATIVVSILSDTLARLFLAHPQSLRALRTFIRAMWIV